MTRYARGWLAVSLATLLSLLLIGGAGAHGSHSSPIQTFTQMVGPYEIGLTIEIPPAAPAPINIDIVVPQDMGEATLTMRTALRGQPFDQALPVEVKTLAGDTQPIYYAQVTIDRLGDWEIELQAAGAQGSGVALIPFTVAQTPLPAYSVPLLVALGSLVALMITMIAVASVYNSRRKAIPAWLSWLLGRGVFAALIVAIVFGALQLNDSTQAARASAQGATYLPAGTLVTGSGRPHVNMVLRANPAAAQVDQPVTLTLHLTDGGTGLPVDDLVTHHEALLHLAVISGDGAFFLHTHPARRGPGLFQIDITPTVPGRYTAFAEIERLDSGTQVLRGQFDVAGQSVAAVPAAGFGTRTIGNIQVTVDASKAVVAGQQTTLIFSFRDTNGAPIRDLSPWLGMAGHVMAHSNDSAIFAHIHAAERTPPYGRPAVTNGTVYGPDIRFVYTFPQPGRYQVWGQFKHAGRVLTVPLTIEVAA